MPQFFSDPHVNVRCPHQFYVIQKFLKTSNMLMSHSQSAKDGGSLEKSVRKRICLKLDGIKPIYFLV